jgi:hypothetical protein
VIASGRVAYANARVRALKSRLLGHEVAGRVMAGLAATRDERPDRARGLAELIDWYVTILKSYPRGQALFRALLRRHEIENIKLLWRAIVNGAADGAWQARWLDFGRLASITKDDCRDRRTLASLVEALRHSPYAAIAHDMWRAHAGDHAAAEHGFDQWISKGILDAAATLPDVDRTAVEIARALVRERDINIARRLESAGLPATPVTLPRAWQRHAPPAADHDRLMVWLRRRRKLLCRQAFLEPPFCLAPPVALLVLKEEELGALDALASFDPAAADTGWLAYALAASELGA